MSGSELDMGNPVDETTEDTSAALREVGTLGRRRVPGTRATIDHVVVTPAGVWVIDIRRQGGQAVAITSGRLTIGGLDATALVEGAARRAGVVAVAGEAVLGPTPIRALLCIEGATWPTSARQPLHAGDVWVCDPDTLRRLVDRPGPVSDRAVRRIAAVIAHRLPCA